MSFATPITNAAAVEPTKPRRMVVGISGASGIAYGVKLLELLRAAEIETHLVVTKPAGMTRSYETDLTAEELRGLADVNHSVTDIGATIASGSFRTMGMIFSSKIGNGIPKILVMEDDVDITDINQVVWAFATRASPGNGEEYFQNESTTNLPIFLSHDEKRYYHATKVVHNCLYLDELTPDERPGKVTFRDGWPQEIQDRVLRNWEAYGYAPANGTSTKERHS
jgi:3-octaprenyl-4-hydroxybenzoate carboxy-lyase/Flavoprotein